MTFQKVNSNHEIFERRVKTNLLKIFKFVHGTAKEKEKKNKNKNKKKEK